MLSKKLEYELMEMSAKEQEDISGGFYPVYYPRRGFPYHRGFRDRFYGPRRGFGFRRVGFW